MNNFFNQYDKQIEIVNSIKNKPIAVWGAGRVIAEVYRILKAQGLNIVCFIDNNKSKEGVFLFDIPIVSEKNIPNEVQFIIVSMRGVDIQTLENINKVKPAMSFNCYYVLKNVDKFKDIYDNVLTDSCSKNVLKNILLANISSDYTYCLEINTPNQYYCIPEFMTKQNDYLADVGAFVGDSIERYIWNNPIFKKIYAFEPAKKQGLALKARVKRLNKEWALESNQIEIIEAGAGDKNGQIKVPKSNDLSNFNTFNFHGKNMQRIKIITLDSIFKNKKVDFIKADIEGAELKMLLGAKNTIKEQNPKIAICVYHNVNDLTDIMDFIKSINPDYKMALRHHSYSLVETVLYCWCE